MWRSISTSCFSSTALTEKVLPFIKLKSNYGHDLKALVDSGCQQTIICNELCDNEKSRPKGPPQVVTILNGQRMQCCGNVVVELWVDDR